MSEPNVMAAVAVVPEPPSSMMVAVFVRRGPWGWIQSLDGDPPEAALTIETLAELPEALTSL